MSKNIAAALAVFFAMSAPAFASIMGDHSRVIFQEEGASQPQQPSGEGEGEGGGEGGGGGGE